MELRSLVPFQLGTTAVRRNRSEDDPFVLLRREIDHLFDDFFGGSGMTRWSSYDHVTLPLDVVETDRELTISAELPGVREQDVEVTLVDDLLTIKGEKVAAREHDDGNIMAERSYGTFSLPLIAASFPRGGRQDRCQSQQWHPDHLRAQAEGVSAIGQED